MSLTRRRRRIVVSVLNVVAAILVVTFLATGGGTTLADVFPSAIERDDGAPRVSSGDGGPGSGEATHSGPVTSTADGRVPESALTATSDDEVDVRVRVVDGDEQTPTRAGATLGRLAIDGRDSGPVTAPAAPPSPTVSAAQTSAPPTVSTESTPPTSATGRSEDGTSVPSGPPSTTSTPATTPITIPTTTTTATLTVVVPDVVGQQHEAAVAMVSSADLAVATCGDACGATVAAQSPGSGSTVPVGTIVTLSLAAEQVTVPSVAGLTGSDAVAALVDAGLGSSCGSRCAEFVAATNPGQGSVVDADSFVTLRF